MDDVLPLPWWYEGEACDPAPLPRSSVTRFNAFSHHPKSKESLSFQFKKTEEGF